MDVQVLTSWVHVLSTEHHVAHIVPTVHNNRHSLYVIWVTMCGSKHMHYYNTQARVNRSWSHIYQWGIYWLTDHSIPFCNNWKNKRNSNHFLGQPLSYKELLSLLKTSCNNSTWTAFIYKDISDNDHIPLNEANLNRPIKFTI